VLPASWPVGYVNVILCISEVDSSIGPRYGKEPMHTHQTVVVSGSKIVAMGALHDAAEIDSMVRIVSDKTK
jgi:hypothetical protein